MELRSKKAPKKPKPSRDDNGFEEWGGYMAAKVAKLTEQYTEIANNQTKPLSNIFNGVAIFVNGYTTPSADELKYLMAAHGGVYHMYQISGATTHIIASNLPNVKIKQLGSVPIVKTAWITDSIASEKLLDYSKYLLYTNVNRNQPLIDFPVVNKSETVVEPKPLSVDNNETKPINLNRYEPKTTKTAADPEFLTEFYNNSRLHLISTLGSECKQLVAQLREESKGHFTGLQQLDGYAKGSGVTYDSLVMHIDMDCFFVSVGLRNRPELRGQPVAVTHAKGSQGGTSRSKTDAELELSLLKKYYPNEEFGTVDTRGSMAEIASCSYEARLFGVKNGMFLGAALKLCPNLKTISYDFTGYREVSKILYNTIATYTLDIEAVSCDEMYVDVRQIIGYSGIAVDTWATHIRQEIMNATGCACSTGFGANRLQARLATRKAKPCGQFHLTEHHLEQFMAEIPVMDLPGVGRATTAKLSEIGIKTCGDVLTTPLSRLQSTIGQKLGSVIFDQARGVDKKPLSFVNERHSVSANVNYGIRFKTKLEVTNFLQSLSSEVSSRIQEIGMRARCVSLELRVRAPDAPQETAKFLGCGICNSVNRSTRTRLISDASSIYKEVKALFDGVPDVPPHELRGIGIQLTSLEKLESGTSGISKFFKPSSTSVVETEQEIKTAERNDNQVDQVEEVLSKKVEEVLPKKVVEVSPRKFVEVSPRKFVDKRTNLTKTSKRGRPKGGSSSKIIKKPANNLMKYFQPRAHPQPLRQEYLKNKIDLDVLNELPVDVRAEIIKEYNLDDQVNTVEETVPKIEVQTENLVKKAESESSIFNNMNRDELKRMVVNWLQSGEAPAQLDVAMISAHLKKLALDRNIEALKTILNLLYRHTARLNLCSWHEAYFSIVEQVQEGMIARYGSTLCVERKFVCTSHC